MVLHRRRNILKSFLLYRHAFEAYKVHLLVLAAFGFISGLLEGVGVNALIPLFSIIVNKSQTDMDAISQMIQRMFNALDINFTFGNILTLIIVLFVLKAILLIYLNVIRVRITSRYEEHTRNALLHSTLAASWPHLIGQKSGHLETVLMVDVPASAQLLNQLSSIIMIVTGLIVYIIVAINISPSITISTLIFGMVLFMLFRPLIKKVGVVSSARTSLYKRATHHISENISGIKTVKAFNVLTGVLGKGKELFRQVRVQSVKIGFLKSITGSAIQPLSVIFIAIIFALTYKSPTFNLAALAVLIYLIQHIFTYVSQLERSFHSLKELTPHLQSALQYGAIMQEHRESIIGSSAFVFKEKLLFNSVSFAYEHGGQVLHHVHFTINKGNMVGLIGPSGSGKTTIVDLILRLLNPSTGEILLDGKNIASINLQEWRKNIGYVSQDIFLMNDSIINNIRFYNASISDADIRKASQMAHLTDLLEDLPKGFDTIVGERGIKLSAGQRQRVVIARALARRPELLILDEATSALDAESELKIQEVIRQLKGNITVIAIAHRLSTIIDSDYLLVLQHGTIIEQGDPNMLLKDKDSYFFKVFNIRKNIDW